MLSNFPRDKALILIVASRKTQDLFNTQTHLNPAILCCFIKFHPLLYPGPWICVSIHVDKCTAQDIRKGFVCW